MSDIIQISDSQIKTAQSCPRLWAYQKVLKLKVDEDRDVLILGDAFHKGAACYITTGGDYNKACHEAIKAIEEGKPTDAAWQRVVAPALLHGWASHWLPGFLTKYEFVAVEQWREYRPHALVEHRMALDVIARNKTTGRICIFDYKTSGQKGGGDLGKTVRFNRQLGLYSISERRASGEWPERVGLVFVRKPKNEDAGAAALDVQRDPSAFFQVDQEVTPDFAAFAMGVEASDVAQALQMKAWRDHIKANGLRGIDDVPANFGSCFKYNRLCGFADGCHSGRPIHTTLSTMPVQG